MSILLVDHEAYFPVDFPDSEFNRFKLSIDLLKIHQILFILSLMKPTEQPTRDNLNALILSATLPAEGPIKDFIFLIQMIDICINNTAVKPLFPF